ncbi:phosphonate transport system substrate-binding protein [Melghirimyces profundicolus]|uniref:Phosphonate transport system substrate-binding protein n=1 Tax=Melghirimyces profundicolus TaxID=1242148 RepID=A0A2T6BGD7_9BACL|nr:phosphate/phosphite/phosphonate ABC transporter substrate-binding protein [Melghirimyces profundicolus]PTX55133.1 phosphonate transport system substrate-binding protein [Melghirimyces profundicolus]
MHWKRALLWISAFAWLLTAIGCGKEAEPFKVGVIPAQNEGNMKQAMERLEERLAEGLEKPVEIKIYSDYQGVVEALKYKKMDMAFLGPLTFVQARETTGVHAVVTQLIDGKPYYHSYLIVPKESGLDSIEEVAENSKKIRFAFGDPNSTSGSLIPGMALKKQGVFENEQEHDFKGITYTGSHDVTALSIQNGKYDVGAIDSAIFNQLVESGKVDKDKVRVIWKSEPLFQYPWAVRKDVDGPTVNKLRKTFLSIKDPKILNVFGASGFTQAENSDYESIRRAAKEAGRLEIE